MSIVREQWEQVLEAERQRLSELRSDLAATVSAEERDRDLDADLSSNDQDPADAASMAYELESDQSLLAQVDHELHEVEAAFERLASGTYGACEACGEPIGQERLRALPAARHCIADTAPPTGLDRG